MQADLLDRYRQALAATPGKLAWSDLSDDALLTRTGFAQEGPQGLVMSREALLLFGTDETIRSRFPFLKTQFIQRASERRRDSVVELPLNFIAAAQAFRSLLETSLLGTVKPSEGVTEQNHVSSLTQVLLAWFLDMLEQRDVTQLRPTRFILDHGYLSLEYAKIIEKSEYLATGKISDVLSLIDPTMQASQSTDRATLERSCFGIAPICIEGRFFKIMAPTPHAFGGVKPPIQSTAGDRDHASKMNSAPIVGDLTGSERARHAYGDPFELAHTKQASTMQADLSAQTMQARQSVPKSTPTEQLGAVPTKNPAATTKSISKRVPKPQPNLRPARPTVQPPSSLVTPTAASERTSRILEFCRSPRHREEIQKFVGMNNRDHFRKEVLNRLIAEGRIRPTLPDKPNSPKQQYVAVESPA